ncbi:hypothetical protein [Pseudonocardia endophytica]|uniref:Uncharacterized protein n=1 Tax=Pseudonocardia endophytica TaxID=401976 RepID=A0A4R1HW27_PSEEN|nr:hypothetical protein [Pseudonocardia endophytica]TCK25215.1 hypothetical protein EV378_1015 [Pseudonocardia endophytica]
MLITFSFTRIAISVRRWFEVAADATTETGARVEIALLEPQEHRGSESAAQRLVVDRTFWRADIFGRTDVPDDPYSAAHFHPVFSGPEPSDRVWSDELTQDAWGWLRGHLLDIERTAVDAGVEPGMAADDAGAVRAATDRIVATAQDLGPEHVLGRDETFRLTRDAALRVRMLIGLVEDPAALDEDYLRPWMDA